MAQRGGPQLCGGTCWVLGRARGTGPCAALHCIAVVPAGQRRTQEEHGGLCDERDAHVGALGLWDGGQVRAGEWAASAPSHHEAQSAMKERWEGQLRAARALG
jgi:hypothetical protein